MDSLSSTLKDQLGGLDLVIVTYNREDTIGKALKSISNWKFDKIICIDHHSSDNTVKIVRDYFPNAEVKYENKGLGYARTLGMQLVTAPFFFFLDSDIVLPEDFLESIIKYLEPSIGAIQGKGNMDHPLWGAAISRRYRGREYRVLRENDRAFTGATLVRTVAAWGADLTRYKMCEDYFLLKHVQKAGYRWIEAFVPIKHLDAEFTAYGNIASKRAENEGAAVRLYHIKTARAFFLEELKLVVRDIYFSIKIRDPTWILFSIRMRIGFARGFLSPRTYL